LWASDTESENSMLNLQRRPIKPLKKEIVTAMLNNWRDLNGCLSSLSLDEVRLLIVHELCTKKRMPMLQRLVARYSRLEARANQAELAKAWSEGLP
jgi:hypothetical protein